MDYAETGVIPRPPAKDRTRRRAKPSAKSLAGKRYPLNMRTTRELRGEIERAAAASGRSLVQEVEYRLEQSFAGDPLVKALTGGGETALRLIALAMQYETAAENGTPWKDDPGKAEAVRTAAHLIIAAIAGLPATPPPPQHDDAVTALRPAERGRLLAMRLLSGRGCGCRESSESGSNW